MMISQRNKQGRRNPWAFGLVAIILSSVLINGYLVWSVVNNPVRLLDENYSVKEHNSHDAKWVKQQAERTTLGWQARLHSPQQLQNNSAAEGKSERFSLAGSPARMQLELSDRDGRPIQGGQVEINAQWPGGPKYDFNGTLHESAPGHYEGSLDFSRAGNWDLLIKAQQNGRLFEMEQKVFVAIHK